MMFVSLMPFFLFISIKTKPKVKKRLRRFLTLDTVPASRLQCALLLNFMFDYRTNVFLTKVPLFRPSFQIGKKNL
jgi:hypothetical protein